MKANINITIDEELRKEMQTREINISGTINQLLKEFLGPQKANPEHEKQEMEFLNFGRRLGISFEEITFLRGTFDSDIKETWSAYKNKFSPVFDFFEWVEVRKKLREFSNKN